MTTTARDGPAMCIVEWAANRAQVTASLLSGVSLGQSGMGHLMESILSLDDYLIMKKTPLVINLSLIALNDSRHTDTETEHITN